MKGFIGTIFLTGMLALCSSTGYACSCVAPSLPEAFEEADAVFAGEVVDIIAPKTFDENSPLSEHFFTLKFKVEKSWKGDAAGVVDVLSGQGVYSCFNFPPVSTGERYLVYAYLFKTDEVRQKSLFVINGCGRTSRIDSSETGGVKGFGASEGGAVKDIKELEQMSKPLPDFRSPDFRLRSKYADPLFKHFNGGRMLEQVLYY